MKKKRTSWWFWGLAGRWAGFSLVLGVLGVGGVALGGLPSAEKRGLVGTSTPLPKELREQMGGTSWREGCPVGLDELRLLSVPYRGPDGKTHWGRLIVAASVAEELLQIFGELFAESFVIEKLGLASAFLGSDERLMEANITSAFNCRLATGSKGKYSAHSYGSAIDINPRWNPYFKRGRVLPPAGKAYLERSEAKPGLIREGDAVVRAFVSRGWRWGGRFRSLQDYQHFEKRRD